MKKKNTRTNNILSLPKKNLENCRNFIPCIEIILDALIIISKADRNKAIST